MKIPPTLFLNSFKFIGLSNRAVPIGLLGVQCESGPPTNLGHAVERFFRGSRFFYLGCMRRGNYRPPDLLWDAWRFCMCGLIVYSVETSSRF